MVEIVSVNPREILRFAGLDVDLPVYAKAAVEDGEVLATWGLAWSHEPRRAWIWFHVLNYRPGCGFVIRREARKCFRHAAQLGETEVFTPRDRQHGSSIKLLRMLGFELHAVEDGLEIWHVRT